MVGFGFSSIGRFGQGGLISERFAPRLLSASEDDLINESGNNLDPIRAWMKMMSDEKPSGHGERCVAVGTLDMALWDAAAKIAELPLYLFLAEPAGWRIQSPVPVYASGINPGADAYETVERARTAGYRAFKIKIGRRCGNDADQWPGRTEALLPAVRKALGVAALLYVDANSA